LFLNYLLFWKRPCRLSFPPNFPSLESAPLLHERKLLLLLPLFEQIFGNAVKGKLFPFSPILPLRIGSAFRRSPLSRQRQNASAWAPHDIAPPPFPFFSPLGARDRNAPLSRNPLQYRGLIYLRLSDVGKAAPSRIAKAFDAPSPACFLIFISPKHQGKASSPEDLISSFPGCTE